MSEIILEAELQTLIERHGHAAVAEAIIKIIDRDFPGTVSMKMRRLELFEAAKRTLVPHVVGHVETERRN